MAKLTKAQRHELDQLRYHLERGIAYLRHESTVVCYRQNRPATCTTDDRSHDGKTSLAPVSIEIGSNIVGLYDALKIVKDFLNEHSR